MSYSKKNFSTVKLLPAPAFLATDNWAKNPDFSGQLIKCHTLLYVTFRKIPKICWSESFYVWNRQVRDLVFYCTRFSAIVLNQLNDYRVGSIKQLIVHLAVICCLLPDYCSQKYFRQSFELDSKMSRK